MKDVYDNKNYCGELNLYITGTCSKYGRTDKKDVVFTIDKTPNQMKELNILARKVVVDHDDEHVHVNIELDCNDRLDILDDFKVDEIVNHIGIFNLLNNIDRTSIVNYLKQTYSDEY